MNIRKLLSIFFISFVFVFSSVAKTASDNFADQFKEWSGYKYLKDDGLTREMPISGEVTVSGNISITLLDETEDGNTGVPFNIESESFTTHPAGHKIGDFSLFSNSPEATLYITAEPLKPVGYDDFSLNYSLVFGYSFTIFDDSGKNSGVKVDEKSISSGSETQTIFIDAGNEHQQLNCRGDIRVKLLGDISQIEMAPIGAYESKIIISMVAE